MKKSTLFVMAGAFFIAFIGSWLATRSLDQAQIQEANAEVKGIPKRAPLATDGNIPAGKHVRIDTGHGSILIELLPEVAPNTVANFKVLAAAGFYDGLTFHRVIPGFMAQGGDPTGTGSGGPGYSIQAEFNKSKHVRGTVAMARTMDPNSAGSQFYICYAPQPHLDGKYTVFGRVIEGMDVVDRIRKGTVMTKVSVLP